MNETSYQEVPMASRRQHIGGRALLRLQQGAPVFSNISLLIEADAGVSSTYSQVGTWNLQAIPCMTSSS